MSDPPPRKVGSLRDRIAAFENKGAAPAPAPPPPRPKPGHVAWQPKPASPTSPRQLVKADNDDGAERKPGAGMSAADAQQSIGKLSLKERMAALQGSTAFGGPASGVGAPPPRPAGEKPKWKPPPVVQKIEPIGAEDEDDAANPARSPPATTGQGESGKPEQSPVDEGKTKEERGEDVPMEEGEPDPEEEERHKRAALAARMARLGGARVGMGPPIFGKKPDVPPKRLSKSEEKPREEESPKEEKPMEVSPPTETVPEGLTVEDAAAIALPPSAAESNTESSTGYFPERKGSGSRPSSFLSPESSTAPTPVRSPHMPVPQAPKRAAPPRKRPAKSPSPAPPVLDEEIQESPSPLVSKDETPSDEQQSEQRGDRQPEVTEGQIEDIVKEVVPQAHEPTKVAEVEEPMVTSEPEPISEPQEEQHISEPPVAVVAEEPATEQHSPEPVAEEPQPEARSPVEPERQMEEPLEAELETQHEEELAPVPAPEEPAEESEEDEAARRKRIAERLAKSGGFNPFAGGMSSPVRRESSDSARSPPFPPRRDSLQEATSPKPSLPERKASVGSVESATARKSSLDVGAFTSEEPHIPEPSAPAPHTRELHEEPIEEGYEDEEAEPRAAGHAAYDDHEEDLVEERESEKYEDTYEHEVAHVHEIAEEPENFEEVSEPAPPPAPPRATRPPPAVPYAQAPVAEQEFRSPPPPPRRDFPPPPPRRMSVPPPPPPPAVEEVEEEHELDHHNEAEAYARHAREVGPDHEADEEPEYHRGEYDGSEEEEYDYHVEEEPIPPPPPRHAPVPPPPPPAAKMFEEDEEEGSTPPPPPPPRILSRGNSLNVPHPPASRPPPALREDQCDESEDVEDVEESEEAEDDDPTPPPPPRSARLVSQIAGPPPVSATGRPVLPPLQRGSSPEQETFDDTDGDPIDPQFYSPQKSPGSSQHVTSPLSMTFAPLASPPLPPVRMVSPPPAGPPPPPHLPPLHRIVSPPPAPERAVSPPAAPSSPPPPPPITSPRPPVAQATSEPQEDEAEYEEDSEQARRHTIAERMAKLGGIRFGAPPPIPSARRAPPPEPEPAHEDAEDAEDAEEKPAEPEEAPQQEEEEDEFARKQRIAARIAGMGGMRFGMLPGTAPPKPPPRVQHDEEDEESVKAPPPPKRSAPIPPPPPPAAEEDQSSESDYQHVSDSDRVEHEESELEEVTYEDAEEEAPPVPDRHGRRVSSGPPPVPQTRPLSPPTFASAPPVPRTRPPAPPAFTYPPPPHVPHPLPTTTETQGDFVVVDQPQSDEPPPPPPPRAARPPGRAPPRAPPAAPAPEAESQWQTPSIPSIDFGAETDLSLSGQWSEDSTNYPPPPVPPPVSQTQTEHPLPATPSRPPPSEQNFTAEELQAQWGRVGVQVHEIAATLFEKSKKSLVGDGSYRGFVGAVIGQVPNAAQPTAALDSFGFLVYNQAGGAVQRRASDIMPGDVIVVSEAKFKGHKGLQSYSQTVGVGEPLVGVIGDFELKKSKVKVLQANQHVGHQSVESVSYRLEDLKSGEVKIYRVLEA